MPGVTVCLDIDAASTGILAVMTENCGPDIDRSIYAMPMFVNLVVSDLAVAEKAYAAAGFVNLATIPGAGDVPSLVHLRREKYQDILMVQGDPASGSTSTTFAAGDVDLSEVAEDIRSIGCNVVGPVDTAWFSTDVIFTDPDGNVVTLTSPRVGDWAEARDWVNDQVTGDFEG